VRRKQEPFCGPSVDKNPNLKIREAETDRRKERRAWLIPRLRLWAFSEPKNETWNGFKTRETNPFRGERMSWTREETGRGVEREGRESGITHDGESGQDGTLQDIIVST